MFVMLASTVLTITILGSAVYLGVRFYEKKRREREIQNFVQALPNRSPAELAEQARELHQRKGVQQYLLPEIRRTMKRARADHTLVNDSDLGSLRSRVEQIVLQILSESNAV